MSCLKCSLWGLLVLTAGALEAGLPLSGMPAAGNTAAVDSLGQALPLVGDKGIPGYEKNKKVGIFYFIWHGEHGTEGPFDINKITEKYPDAPYNPSRFGPDRKSVV